MITNTVKKIDKGTIEIPLIIKADQEGWIPTFDVWSTKINEDTSYIECTQNFRPELKKYEITRIDPKIGSYTNDNLIIYWKALVSSDDLETINNTYKGKLRATSWQKRYCTYFGTGSNMPWLHTVILGCNEPEYVVHHINGVSADNRHQNLHLLPKKEHDSINHPKLDERKQMFVDPQEYWQRRKSLAIEEFIMELTLIITNEGKTDFLAKFAKENLELVKEILTTAKFYLNLSSINSEISKNRLMNPHLKTDYLDAYEIEKYLKRHIAKDRQNEGQLKLF